MAKNYHDKTFQALMQQRTFALSFLQAHLPPDLQEQIDWNTLQLLRIDGKHIENAAASTICSDIVYLVNVNHEPAMLWTHIEHQSTPDRWMALRVLQYQVATLLSHARSNDLTKLPAIISIIYYQGKVPYPYPVDLPSLFIDQEVAVKYLGKPILVDLPGTPDQALLATPTIGGIEFLLKHIRKKGFEKFADTALKELKNIDDNIREIVLEHVLVVADLNCDVYPSHLKNWF